MAGILNSTTIQIAIIHIIRAFNSSPILLFPYQFHITYSMSNFCKANRKFLYSLLIFLSIFIVLVVLFKQIRDTKSVNTRFVYQVGCLVRLSITTSDPVFEDEDVGVVTSRRCRRVCVCVCVCVCTSE